MEFVGAMNDNKEKNSDTIERFGVTVKALRFAAIKHRYQLRKNAERTPYINHPIIVMNILWEIGGVRDEDVLSAAILHDVIEDTHTTRQELLENFGQRVCQFVFDVTDDKGLDKKERKRQQVEHAAHISEGGKLVKLGDKISNVSDIISSPPAGWSFARKIEYIEWSKQVVDNLRGVNKAMEERFDQLYEKGISDLKSKSSKSILDPFWLFRSPFSAFFW